MKRQISMITFFNRSFYNCISVLTITLTIFGLINCSDNSNLSGGTTIGNPHTISGIIVDSIGNAIPNLRLNLLPADYNPLSDITSDNTTETGDLGEYEIIDVYDGKYVLNATLIEAQKLLYVNVLIDGNDEERGQDTIKSTGVISVYLTNEAYSADRFLYIPGTEIYTAATNIGYNNIISPAGRINLAYYDTSAGGSIIDEGPNYTYIPVQSNDTITIDSHTITLADKPEGPAKPNVGDSCTYLIRNGSTSLLHPIEYRFRYIEYVGTPGDWWVNSDTTTWSINNSILLIWPKAAEYKIQAQVRSTVDTTVISTFYPTSNFLKVIVTDTL